MDYDFIVDGDWAHRVRLFEALTAEEKAEFLRTHRQRWLDTNRHRLSPEQIAALEQDIEFIVPALYRQPRDADLDTRKKQREDIALALFDRHDAYDLTLHGHRVPIERRPNDLGG